MDAEPDSSFPVLLRRLRVERGLNQEQLAAKVGVSDASISYWETGKYAPNYANVLALATFLEAPELLAAAGFDQHDEFASMRAELLRQGQEFESLKADFQRQGREFEELRQKLIDVLRRLPDA